jgi:hypothetical protein
MSEPKFGPTQFKAEVEKLRREGRMPSLGRLLDAIAEARAEYREKILAARRKAKGGSRE